MYSGLKAWIEIHFLASTLTLSPIAHSHYCCTPTKGQHSKAPSIKPFVHFIDRSRCDSNRTSIWSYFSSPPSLNLSHSCSLPLVHAVSLPHLAITLATHFFFQKLRITAAPPREVCENAQCRSPGVPTPGAECEKRALHLMPDWPNLLPDSWVFLFPVAQGEHGQKWCGRRREGTVIVSRSVEIPRPPTHLSPPPSLPPSSP